MTKKPIWIDVDTGLDDSIALLLAMQLENVDIKGISAVAGNVELSKTFPNTRNIVHLANRNDIKVYKGAKEPLNIEQVIAAHIHGNNGLANIELENSPAEEESVKAWDKLYEVAKESNGNLEIVAVGPLTNIAIAIAKYPDLEKYVNKIIIMGGAIVGGNTTPSAEFNIYGDPHAAEAVFKSNIPKVMFGLDATLKSSLKLSKLKRIHEKDTDVIKYFKKATEHMKNIYETLGFVDTVCLHDACPVLYLEYPELFEGVEAGVYVETQGTHTLGKTVSDIDSDFKFEKRDTLVMLEVNQPRFSDIVEELILRY